MTTTRGNRELDDAAGGERASVRHRAARRTAPMGGSNRLLSVEELAAYLGVPKKTVYGCWRQWGLRGYRVGRYLRFRERHVEEWLQIPGGIATVAKIFKRCPCPEDQWDSCPHRWVVRYRTAGGRSSRQREQSFGTDLREAEDFALKVEHDKRARVFVDPKGAGRRCSATRPRPGWTSTSARIPASPPTGRCCARTSTPPSAASQSAPSAARTLRHSSPHAPQGPVCEPDRLRPPGHQRCPCRGGPRQEAPRIPLHRHPTPRRRHRSRLHLARARAGGGGGCRAAAGLGRHGVADARLWAKDRRGPRCQRPLPY